MTPAECELALSKMTLAQMVRMWRYSEWPNGWTAVDTECLAERMYQMGRDNPEAWVKACAQYPYDGKPGD